MDGDEVRDRRRTAVFAESSWTSRSTMWLNTLQVSTDAVGVQCVSLVRSNYQIGRDRLRLDRPQSERTFHGTAGVLELKS